MQVDADVGSCEKHPAIASDIFQIDLPQHARDQALLAVERDSPQRFEFSAFTGGEPDFTSIGAPRDTVYVGPPFGQSPFSAVAIDPHQSTGA